MTIADLQALIRKMYFEKDAARGAEATFLWLVEEVGELATAVRCASQGKISSQESCDRENLAEEFADVIAWLATLANILEVDLTQALARKYGTGCPGCGKLVCVCPDTEKP